MASPFTASTPSKKRTINSIERECREEEAAHVGLEVKRRCNKADNDGGLYTAGDGVEGRSREALSEDNPETWTTQAFEEMWSAIDEKFSEWMEAQPNTQEEQTFQEQLGGAGDWNMNEGTPEQKFSTAAQDTNLVSSCPSLVGSEEPQRRESVPQDSCMQPQPLPTSSAVQEVRPNEVNKPGWETRPSSQAQVLASSVPHDNFFEGLNELDLQFDRHILASKSSALKANPPSSSAAGNAECGKMAAASWQQSSLNLTHSNPSQTGLETGSVQGRPGFAHGLTLPLPQGLGLPHTPSQYPQLPNFNPVLAAGMVEPRPLNVADPTTGASNSRLVTYFHKEKRGAPRQRMFTSMPRIDQPLSSRALTDDEEVLISFPEHLCLPEVMQRFVRPGGARQRLWPTQRMVDFLMRHKNARDYAGITREVRRANVKRWVTKERDACNSKLRKDRETGKKSTKEATSTSADQNGPASTGQPIPLCVVLQGVPEPQNADSMSSHAHDTHLGMPSAQDPSHDSQLTGLALPGHRYNASVSHPP
jgi:hypothetical protein